MNNLYYLSHGGPGSGRYPWGSGDRPYQRLEGSGQRPRGISGYIRSRKMKKEEERQQKEKAELQKRKIDEEKQKEQMEKDKERVLRSGTSSEVMRYQGQLTNKELQEAADRIRLEKQLNGYTQQEIKTALDKIKKIQSYTNVGSALAKDGIELWNSFAAIYNATPEGRKSPLTLVKKG